MGAGTRQWKALMRKNFINWKRQAKCSFFEICCPAFVMFLMVILRNVIEPTTIPNFDLIKLQTATFPGFAWDGQEWTTNIGDLNKL